MRPAVIGEAAQHADPLPQALVLTAIVIGFAMTLEFFPSFFFFFFCSNFLFPTGVVTTIFINLETGKHRLVSF